MVEGAFRGELAKHCNLSDSFYSETYLKKELCMYV